MSAKKLRTKNFIRKKFADNFFKIFLGAFSIQYFGLVGFSHF